MKFRCERDVLVDALGTAGRAATNRAALPVLSHLRLQLTDDRLRITGSDLDLTITKQLQVAGITNGVAVLPAKLTVDIVRNLESGAVEVDTSGDRPSIRAGRSEFFLNAIPADEYPNPQEPDGESVTLQAGDLADGLRQVVGAASSDESRPILTGVLLAAEEAGIRLVSTDSYRLAYRDLPGTSLLEQGQQVLVPSRALTLPDAIRIVATRASVVDRLTGDYAVAALGISAAAALELIAATPGWLELAVVNAENSVAVAGERSAVRMAVAEVRGHGALARDITVNFPVHTSVLEPLRDALHPDWPPGVFSDTAVQFIGGTTGAVVAAGTPFPDYWYRNLRDTVRFDRAVESAVGLGAGIFVEMSAHPALLFATAAVLGERPAVLVGSGRRDAALPDVLAAGLATVAASDPAYRWRTLHRSAGGGLRDVPGTAMRTDSFWLAPAPEPAAGPVVTIAAETWIEVFAAQPQSATTVAVVALGAEVLGGTMRAAAQQHRGARVVPVEDAELLIVLAPDGLDDPDPVTAAEALASLIGSGLLRYPTAIGNRCRTVCLVTVRAEQVSTIDPPARPGQAALAAMHRSVGREHPGVTFDQLDLPSTDADPIPVLDAVLGSTGTRALRTVADRPVLVRRSMIEVPGTPESRVSLDEVVITGGSGGIAGHCVRILAARGARRIVLLGRRELDPSTLAALRGGHDTELVSVPCDLRDPHAVAAAATTYGGAGAALVIHTAGTGQFHAAAELDTADVADGFGAKVIGLANLTRYWPLRDDARILLCSSVSGLWGGSGHAAYGAANRVLDVMAAQLRAAGRDCSALRFGLWDAPSAIVDDAQTVNITRSGLRPMPPAAAVEAMLAGLPGDPLIYAADAKRLATFLDAGSAAQPDPPGADAATVLQAELAAVLDLGDGPVDLGESLFDLGVDSLLAVELRNRLKGRLGRTVTLATLLSGVTGNQIVAELEQQKVDHA